MSVSYKNRLFAVMLAASVLLSGCGKQEDDYEEAEEADAQFSDEAREIADEYFAGDRSSFTSWAGTDDSTVIASVDDPTHIPYFDITYGEFIDEYFYYLISGGIEDDMAEDVKETCKGYRVNLINYLTFERMFLYAAEHDYGITEDSLTEEQLDELNDSAEQLRDDWSAEFYAAASAKLGDDADDIEINDLCHEVLDVILDKCGIDYDMFYSWELNSKLQELCLERITADAAVSDEQVSAEIAALAEKARETAESDPETYENTQTYQTLYIPEGTRKARHIMLHYKSGGYDEAMAEEAGAAAAKLTSDGGFEELMQEYGGEDEHIVLKNSTSYSPSYISALYSAGKPGDVCEIVAADDGVYIIQYTADAVISGESADELAEQMREYLESTAQTNAQIAAYDEWSSKYVYNIDCDAIKISPEDIIQQNSDYEGIIG